MQGWTRARAGVCAATWTRVAGALVLVLALAASGCTTDRAASPVAAASGPTIAFESIDGPPPAVFNRLVDNLGTEAEARRMAVVSRRGQAKYRVRGYLAASVEAGKVQIGWVWDVYDAERRRALRISGEETAAGRKPADAWAAADESMLRRIAQTSLDRMMAFLTDADSPAPAGPQGPAIAHSPPEAAGPALAALFGR